MKQNETISSILLSVTALTFPVDQPILPNGLLNDSKHEGLALLVFVRDRNHGILGAMEVVGTVAATFQLVGLAMSLLDSIAQLHDVINLVPDRYQRWHTELHVLGAMINCIQQDSALHTSQVNQVLENMSPKIKSLLRLCRKYTPPANAGRIIKAIKILSAHAVEPRITEYLQSLEHDKTTLLLAIQLIPTMASSMKDLCLTDDAVYNCSPRNSDEAHSKSVSLMNPGDSKQARADSPHLVKRLPNHPFQL